MVLAFFSYYLPRILTIADVVTGTAFALHDLHLQETVMVDVVNVKYRPDRAVVQVSGVIEEEMILPLVAVLKQLHFEFHYVHIEMEVSSPGGQVPALTYLVSTMDALRAKGVRFTTRALLNCASAAANLVSLGDYREASINSTFLYHQVRAIGETIVTVQSARQLLSDADEIDGEFSDRMARRARQSRPARPAPGIQDFSGSDWRTIVYLLIGTGAAGALPEGNGKKTNRRQLLAQLRRHVAACLKDDNDAPLARLYRKLFELDAPISAALALTLRLVDAIPELAPRAKQSMAPADYLTIPEWAPLHQHGQVPRSLLCRHTLVLGETGSGKTLSGVLPAVRAVMAPENPSVGCALVIDPKREIKAHVAQLSHDAVDVIFIDVHRAAKRPVMNLMAGELAAEVDADLEQDRYLDAARRLLVRAASLSPTSPARVLAGLPGHRRDSYWESEGSRLAQTLLALALMILKHRVSIYGGDRGGGWWRFEDHDTRQALLDFGDAAGVVRRDPAVMDMAERLRERLEIADDLMEKRAADAAEAAEQAAQGAPADAAAPPKDAGQDGAAQPGDGDKPADEPACYAGRTFCETTLGHIREFTGALTETGLYRSSARFRERVEYALADAREILEPETDAARQLSADPDYCRQCARELAEASGKAAVWALPDAEARPGPNALALANSTLSWFNAEKRKSGPMLIESVVAASKKYLTGGDADEIYRKLAGWMPMAKVTDAVTYLAIAGFSRNCFADFADGAAAHTLYFGVEPYYRALAEHGRDDRALVDFNGAVNDETKRRVYVFQPRLDDNEALLARALKAIWFESILSSRKRQARGGEMPLAAYIADEFHRFVTANKSHGEQSFLDTCRSFGVFCVLACQSISSIEHALSEGSDRWEMNRSALSIILNNTANKLFFRSTDEALQEHIDRLCPVTPELGRVTTFRPPSTLQPGECYASLADGRFERRQLLPFGARQAGPVSNLSNEVVDIRSVR